MTERVKRGSDNAGDIKRRRSLIHHKLKGFYVPTLSDDTLYRGCKKKVDDV